MFIHPRRRSLGVPHVLAGVLAACAFASPAMAASDGGSAAGTARKAGGEKPGVLTVRKAGGRDIEYVLTVRKAGGRDIGYIIAVL
jgi:hypothetical protein